MLFVRFTMTKICLLLALIWGSLFLMALSLTRVLETHNNGDPARGEKLYNGDILFCTVCHISYDIAPATEGMAARIAATSLRAPENASKRLEEYLVESILDPEAYVLPGYYRGVMPRNYAEHLTWQDLKDLIAYIMTQ